MKINHRVPLLRHEDKDENEVLIAPNIFKAYDIRGIYPDDVNEETTYKIGQAFVKYTKAKRVVVGQDCRLSSPFLFKSITRGITSQGADVYNIGQVSTDCLYFAVGKYGYEGGIMITASHNPKEYNGFKMIKEGAAVIRGIEIKEIIFKPNFFKTPRHGMIKDLNIWQDYLTHIFSFINVNKIKVFKVVVDAGNGMAGKVMSFLVPRLPITIIPLNFDLDGNFPVHSPNPLAEGVTKQIRRKVLKEKADFGFIFDGDADRIFLIDEQGNSVRGDITLLLLAKYFLKKNPGAGITYNAVCSKAVPEFIKKWKGKPIRTPVGFVNIRDGMIKNGGVLGGELSGHYCFKDNFYSDSGFIAFLILLQIISENRRKLSEIIAELSPYTKSSEINFEVKQKEAILNEIKKRYSDGRQDYLDGITVEYDDWWFNIRPSQTEPILRLTIETRNKRLLKEKKKELIKIINSLKN